MIKMKFYYKFPATTLLFRTLRLLILKEIDTQYIYSIPFQPNFHSNIPKNFKICESCWSFYPKMDLI